MAQITSVTSEALQAKIRQLLPSQQGFGEDLQAQNVIVPIIDLTETAEGSSVRQDLQTALAFGSQTAHLVNNTSSTIVNTAGFYRVTGVFTFNDNDTAALAQLILSDGATDKIIYGLTPYGSGGVATNAQNNIDFTVFVNTGESIKINAASTYTYFYGTSRQIADINGNLTNPSGFTPQ